MAEAKNTAVKTSKKSNVKEAVEVKTIEQLQTELATQRNDLQESRRSHRLGELVNPKVLGEQRKKIARTLTALKASGRTAKKEEN